MNSIPKSNADVLALATHAAAGAEAHGAAIKLRHNTAPKLNADLHELTGDPAEAGLGKQARLNAQLRQMHDTYKVQQAALKAARTFCLTGIGVLKPRFGYRWNSEWLTAGFTARSLAVPALPLAMLIQFRNFLTVNPDCATAEFGFTAKAAQEHFESVQSAVQARETARGGRWSVKAVRDLAFRKLRKRLSNLRAELALLLAPTDDRWYAFGFRRPADGRQPDPVKDLAVTPLNAPESIAQSSNEQTSPVEAIAPARTTAVAVTWRHCARARKYRVNWRLAASTFGTSEAANGNALDLSQREGAIGEALESRETEEVIVTRPECTLVGLPVGVPLIISVRARNSTGETPPAETRFVAGYSICRK